MKLFAYSWAFWFPLLLLGTASAQQRTAQISGNSRSIYLGPANSGTVRTYFTTFDGTTGPPLTQPIGGGNFIFSGELRPRANFPGDYEADFATYGSTGLREYGSFYVTIANTNSDTNSLPNIFQLNKAAAVTTTGYIHVDAPNPRNDAFTLMMSRPSNQLAGSYSFKMNSDASFNPGTFQLLNLAGPVSYIRSNASISFNIAFTEPLEPLGTTRTLTGSTNYTVPNANQIVLPQFSVTGGGQTLTFVSGIVLNRTGSRYAGNASVNDGMPETSWPDGTNWVIEINDPNDWDANGIPDLSDTIPISPIMLSPPQSQTVIAGSNATFSVGATGSMPLGYQWQFNSNNLPGATGQTLTLTNVQSPNAGDYRVVVSNGGGSITSLVATLTVIYPPFITDDPVNATVTAGDSAQFNVAATGSEPIYYQWRHGTTNLPGATYPIFSIFKTQPSDEGQYSVVVSNAAGIAISATVSLTVLIPPTITTQPESQSAKTNSTVSFVVTADGSAVLSYQWMRNGTNVPHANSPNLVLSNVREDSGGVFNVRVSNGGGSVLSSNALLYVGLPLTMTNLVRQANGVVHGDLIGLPGSNYIVQTAATLSNWVSLVTNSSPRGIMRFTDPNDTTGQHRFYRAKLK